MNKLSGKMTKAFLAFLFLSGCGPNYQRPPLPPMHNYTSEPLPSHTVSAKTVAGKSQHFVKGLDIPAEWWKVFHSKPLNQLIEAALAANPDLQAADAGLRIAEETALAQRALYFPRADASFIPTRQETAHTLTPVVATEAFFYTLITPQLTISYSPDLFGANRRAVEALEAEVALQGFQREALILTVSSNIVLAVIQEAALRAQIRATEEVIMLAKRQLKMLKEEHAAGEIGLEAVAGQEALLAQILTTLPTLKLQLSKQDHLIAILCGNFPSMEIVHQFELKQFHLPKNLPLTLPSLLVIQRPDIRAAEAIAHAAAARIGVAIAQRLPNILLSGVEGASAYNFSTLFQPHTIFGAITANVAQSIFNAGFYKHKQRAAEAAFEQADAQYRSVVISAFKEVADTLKIIQYDALTLKASQEAVTATKRSLNIATQQWKAGALGYLPVLIAQRAYQEALITLAQSQANRLSDTVALFQALGGGWWNRDCLG